MIIRLTTSHVIIDINTSDQYSEIDAQEFNNINEALNALQDIAHNVVNKKDKVTIEVGRNEYNIFVEKPITNTYELYKLKLFGI